VAAESGRFRKEEHLLDGRDFRRVSRNGERYRTQHFVVLASASAENLPTLKPRLGLTVSRKVGNAVVRNRMKRRLREWFRHHRGQLACPVDLVVIVRPQGANLDYEQVCRELGEIARKIGVTKLEN
jgi:ribonuclease P protein component